MITPAYITKEMAGNIEDSLRIGAEAGISTVAVRSKVWGHDVEDLSPEQVGSFKQLLESHGQKVSTMLSPVGKCDIEDEGAVASHIDIFRRTIPVAKALQASFIRVFSWCEPGLPNYGDSHLDQYLDRIVERTKPLIEIAEKESTLLVFECVQNTLAHTGKDLRRVLDALGNPPCARAVWDIDVAAKAGESPQEGYSYLRGLIEEVHIKPNSAGNIDPIDGVEGTYVDAFQLLADDGYDGFATIEHWRGTEGILRGLKQLREILSRIQ